MNYLAQVPDLLPVALRYGALSPLMDPHIVVAVIKRSIGPSILSRQFFLTIQRIVKSSLDGTSKLQQMLCDCVAPGSGTARQYFRSLQGAAAEAIDSVVEAVLAHDVQTKAPGFSLAAAIQTASRIHRFSAVEHVVAALLSSDGFFQSAAAREVGEAVYTGHVALAADAAPLTFRSALEACALAFDAHVFRKATSNVLPSSDVNVSAIRLRLLRSCSSFCQAAVLSVPLSFAALVALAEIYTQAVVSLYEGGFGTGFCAHQPRQEADDYFLSCSAFIAYVQMMGTRDGWVDFATRLEKLSRTVTWCMVSFS
jgi:hypothetical protein